MSDMKKHCILLCAKGNKMPNCSHFDAWNAIFNLVLQKMPEKVLDFPLFADFVILPLWNWIKKARFVEKTLK